MEELSIKEIFKGIWKRKLIIIILTIIFLILGILYSSKGEEVAIVLGTKKTPVKYASTIFTITQTEEYKIDNTTVDTYFNILKTRTKMNNIIKKFDLDITTQELIESIEIKRLDYSDIIEISITNEKIKDNAVDILNELLVVLQSEINRIYLLNDVYIIEEPYLHEIEEKVDEKGTTVESNDNTKKVIIITLAGMIIGFVVVVGLEFIDNTIKNENQIKTNFKVDNLATIKLKQSDLKDELRKVKLVLNENKVIMVTGFSDKRKKEIIDTLLELYVKYDKKVSYLDITNDNLEKFNVEFKDNKLNYIKQECNEDLVSLLEKEEMLKILDNLKKEKDIILINANNICKSVNSFAMSKFVDTNISIVEERKTKVQEFENSLIKLNKINSDLVGTIFLKK